VATAGWIGLAALLVLMPTTNLFGPFLYRGGFILIDVACAAIVLAVLDASWKGGWLFQQKPFVALGLVSYGFYLWHMPVFYFVRRFDTNWPLWLRVVVAFALTLGLTVASWFLLEKPIMEWKDRLERRRRPGEEPTRVLTLAEEPAPSVEPALPLIPSEKPTH
jgi:peptidoglycan/LPS O-acetylase OafA/YrhL